MKRYPILEVCARIEGHVVQQNLLRDLSTKVHDWYNLLDKAEREGMSLLLRKHLTESEIVIPPAVRRSLYLLYKRHQKQSNIRMTVLQEVLASFQQEHLTPLLLKGVALCLTLYPDPVLRPMRDMDILLSRDEVDTAQQLLREQGFEQSSQPIPPDHHHLPPLLKTVEGVMVCIELHRDLYPKCSPHYPEVDFDSLRNTAHTFSFDRTEALVFNCDEMLTHLFLHGLRAPLTYEPYKLINAADIIGYTEKYFLKIDWGRIKNVHSGIYRSLPLLHHISPWNDERIPEDFISVVKRKRRLQPVSYSGWPGRRLKQLTGKASLYILLKETFFPFNWWLRVYYGAGYSTWRSIKALCLEHPKNVLWWVKLHCSFLVWHPSSPVKQKKNLIDSLILLVVSLFCKISFIVAKLCSI